MRTSLSFQLLAAAIPFVSAHGLIADPKPRLAGLAMKAACGEQVYNNQASDSGGNIQGILQVAASQKDYDATKCNVALCKGYQFEDNTANIQTFSAGQVVPIKVEIRAPHTGVANVSIVDTKLNQVIGEPLISFDDYASNSHTIPANNTAFSITLPQDFGGKCGVAGECVIQWFWDAPSIQQTYESCIDFKTGAGGATPPVAPAAPAAPSASGAASAVAPAASSAVPAAPAVSAVPVLDDTDAGDDDGESCDAEDGEVPLPPAANSTLPATLPANSTLPAQNGTASDDGESCDDVGEEDDVADAPVVNSSYDLGDIEKRQIMETLSTGPKTTLGVSVVPMSSTTATSSSTGSRTSSGAPSSTASGTTASTAASGANANNKASVLVLMISAVVIAMIS